MELPDVRVFYQPILDVSRGITAGYHAVTMPLKSVSLSHLVCPATRRHVVATTIRSALSAISTLPTNTFVSIPVPVGLIDDPLIERIFCEHGDLSGVVLDITEIEVAHRTTTESSLDSCRRNGALISVGGRDDEQHDLAGIVRLRPAIIRLGSSWTHELDQRPALRSAIEITGQLASQLDAWILADDVRSGAELRALAELNVPLARGPFIGGPQRGWPKISEAARIVLPPPAVEADGALRELLQQAYTTRHPLAAQTVLPDASGFEYVVVIDEDSRPVSLLTQGIIGRWDPIKVLTINIDTPVADTVSRALARPRATRFSPIACTDAAGRFVGILRIERLMEHLATRSS